ncbi:hypothetical protein BGZ83_007549 [Gryganskiella cystojenkinii]|nr:hypothetical protein BGZ83_007549 [Gryganskiella cystojenkinii]
MPHVQGQHQQKEEETQRQQRHSQGTDGHDTNADSINKELDQLVVLYMTLVQDYHSAWTRISEKFQEGREQISQAKYVMGPRNVSADCYDLRMKALRGVSVEKDTVRIQDLLVKRRQQEQAQEQLKAQDSGKKPEQESETDTDLFNNGQIGSGLRRRGGNTSSSTSSLVEQDQNIAKDDEDDDRKKKATAPTSNVDSVFSSPSSTLSSKTTSKKKERNPDPLLWFGVFVPGSLRTAQTAFKQGLEDVAMMATVQHKLVNLEKDILRLQSLQEQPSSVVA